MAKKPTPAQPESAPTLATAGGSYLADEAAGAVLKDGPAEAPLCSRRGFGEPTEPAGSATPATVQE